MSDNKKLKLCPEEKCAIEKLISSIQYLKPKPRSYASKDIYIQGNITMFAAPFSASNIPSEKIWRWNQTKSQKHVALSGGITVIFAKLIPRKTKTSENIRAPYYKLWQYNIAFPNGKNMVALWCEKGINEVEAKKAYYASALDAVFPNVSDCSKESNASNKLYAAKISFICN